MHTIGTEILIKVNDTTICYDDKGSSNIPVIFIHGFPFDKSSWQPQFDYLQKYYRTIIYDNRGYGKSSAGEAELSMDLFADDLVKFMELLQIEKAIVCGLSMGGYILLNAINRYPERFHAIILSDTQCIADTPEGKEKRLKTIDVIEKNGLVEFAEGFIKNIFCKESLESKKDIVEHIKKTVLSTNPKVVTATLKALAERSETCSVLNDINVPALILCGKDDIITTPAQSETLHKNIKGSTLYFIEQAAHVSNLEQPEEFNRKVMEFVKLKIEN